MSLLRLYQAGDVDANGAVLAAVGSSVSCGGAAMGVDSMWEPKNNPSLRFSSEPALPGG